MQTSQLKESSHLSEHNNHLHHWRVLVAQNMVSKHRARVSAEEFRITPPLNRLTQPTYDYTPVSADCHAFKNAIRSAGDDVVELVGHAARAGHVGHAAWTVKLGGQDVIQHASSVADLKAARLYSSDLHKNNRRSLLRQDRNSQQIMR